MGDEFRGRAYLPFHAPALAPQARPTAEGTLIEPHDPLLPILLAVPTAAGGWVLAKVVLCVIAGAFAALTLWIAVRRFGVPVGPAGAVVAVLAASAPPAYGSQVYPEIVAALVVAAAVAALTGRLGPGGWRLAAALVLGAVGIVAQAFVVVEALRGDITWVVNLRDTANPVHRAWRTVLPDYLDATPMTWVLHTAWSLAAIGAAALAYRAVQRRAPGAPDREDSPTGAPALADTLVGS